MIVVCEIAFWVFVLAGLISRYVLKRKKLGSILLLATPVVDLVLLAVTIIHLNTGIAADFTHSLAAVYIGVTIGFGKRMIKWADERFAYRFANGQKPEKVKHGRVHARREREGWLRHLLSWSIGCLLLGLMILLIGEPARTEELTRTIYLWSIVLAADFVISFSYTIWPKKEKKQASL